VPTERDLTIKPRVHPIVPFMVGDAAKSQKLAAGRLRKIFQNFGEDDERKKHKSESSHKSESEVFGRARPQPARRGEGAPQGTDLNRR
jgi:hypothetical protein